MAVKLNNVDEVIGSDSSVLNVSQAVGKLNDTYTKAEVHTYVATNAPAPDLSQYYTKGEVDTQISNIDIGVARSESANYIDFTFA